MFIFLIPLNLILCSTISYRICSACFFVSLFVRTTCFNESQARAILPEDLQVTYGMSPKMDLGLALKVSGNRYHGDPDTWDAENPQFNHAIVTVGPTAKVHFSRWVHLNLEGGYVLYHNFEFGDGDRTDNAFHLHEAGYLRADSRGES